MIRGLTDIGAEAVLLAGAGRAILLQVADPSVGHGVAEHSNFTERPLDRLRATMTYLYAVAYGSQEQLTSVRRAVNRAHARVRREPDGSSRGYNAFDRESQLWVAATLYDTAVLVYEQVHGPLDDDVADAIYREYAFVGTARPLPPELWPAARTAFRRYWDDRLSRLRPDDIARRIARDLLHPHRAPILMRLALPLARLLTAGLLPERIRSEFGFSWSEARSRRFEKVMGLLSVAYPKLPRGIRHGLKDHLLGRLDVEPSTSASGSREPDRANRGS